MSLLPSPAASTKDSVKIGTVNVALPTLSELTENAEAEIQRYSQAGRRLKSSKGIPSEVILPHLETPAVLVLKGSESYDLGKECQDAVSFYRCDSYTAAFVSDGVSTTDPTGRVKSRTEYGASFITDKALEYIMEEFTKDSSLKERKLLDPKFLSDLYMHILKEVLTDASAQAKDFEEFRALYSANLQILIRINGGESIHLSIGDGVLVQSSGEMKLFQDFVVEEKVGKILKDYPNDTPERKKMMIDAIRATDVVVMGFKFNGIGTDDFTPVLRINAHGAPDSELSTKPIIFGSDGLRYALCHQPREGTSDKSKFPLVNLLNRPEEEVKFLAEVLQFCSVAGDAALKKEDELQCFRSTLSKLYTQIMKDNTDIAYKYKVGGKLLSAFDEQPQLLAGLIADGFSAISDGELKLTAIKVRSAWIDILQNEGIDISTMRQIRDDVALVYLPAIETTAQQEP